MGDQEVDATPAPRGAAPHPGRRRTSQGTLAQPQSTPLACLDEVTTPRNTPTGTNPYKVRLCSSTNPRGRTGARVGEGGKGGRGQNGGKGNAAALYMPATSGRPPRCPLPPVSSKVPPIR